MSEITIEIPMWGNDAFLDAAKKLDVSTDALFSFFAAKAVHAQHEKDEDTAEASSFFEEKAVHAQ